MARSVCRVKPILILFLLWLSLPLHSADLPETVSEGLVLEARVDKTTFRVGEAIKVTVVMRNESEVPLLVITNFGWEISEAVYFDGYDVLIPNNPPGDAHWSHVDFLTPFCEQYEQDHDFPQTLKIFARKYPCDTRSFEDRRFWYDHLTCMAPGAEVDAWYYYRVSSLPEELTEGNYDIRFRYQLNEWLLDEFMRNRSRILEDNRLASCFARSSQETKESGEIQLPLFRGLALSNTLRLRVVRSKQSH